MSIINNQKLIYIFGAGRKIKIDSDQNYPKEFFYSYHQVKNYFENVNLLEFDDENLNNKLTLLIDKILRKISGLSFYTNSIISKRNYRTLKDADIVIATNDRIGLSILPMVFLIKVRKKIKVQVFVMGLFSNKSKNILISFFQKLFLIYFIKSTDNFIFLGKPELEEARRAFPKYQKKFSFIPFSTDTDFWNPKDSYNFENRKGILFVGNDSFRDYKFVQELAKNMPEFEFTFVSSQIEEDSVKADNINLISGKWNKNILSDFELKDLYEGARITILPLRETIQPSGQSVALQSMALGTPVLITKTSGFWEEDNYRNNENIVFIDENNLNIWIKEIADIYNNVERLKKISTLGTQTIVKNYKIETFTKKMLKIINN